MHQYIVYIFYFLHIMNLLHKNNMKKFILKKGKFFEAESYT